MPRPALAIITALCSAWLCSASAQTPQPRGQPAPSAPPPVLAPLPMRPDLAITEPTVSWSHPQQAPIWGNEGETFALQPGARSIVSLPANRRLMICFRVVNIGRTESGPFRVVGTGLNRPANHNYELGVSPGDNTIACLHFTTPATLGDYVVRIRVDAQQMVSELREDNNELNVRLRITHTPDH